MSLNWNLSDIEDHEEKCWIKQPDGQYMLNPVTNSIIWCTMAVGIGRITKKNWKEFYARVHAWELLNEMENHLTPEAIRDHIGLSTNVFPEETRPQWLKRVVTRSIDDFALHAARASVRATTPASLEGTCPVCGQDDNCGDCDHTVA